MNLFNTNNINTPLDGGGYKSHRNNNTNSEQIIYSEEWGLMWIYNQVIEID